VSGGAATQYARAVADAYLGDRAKGTTLTASHVLTDAEAVHIEGLYRDVARGTPVAIVRDQGGVRVERGAALVAMSPSRFVTSGNDRWEFNGGGARLTDEFGTVVTFERVSRATPTIDELRALTGTYTSDEAQTTFTAAVDARALVLKQRPDRIVRLTPVYADAFSGGSLGTVIFRRDAGGRVTALSIIQDRVWDLRFARQAETTSTR
jgi:hypothetical protein